MAIARRIQRARRRSRRGRVEGLMGGRGGCCFSGSEGVGLGVAVSFCITVELGCVGVLLEGLCIGKRMTWIKSSYPDRIGSNQGWQTTVKLFGERFPRSQ